MKKPDIIEVKSLQNHSVEFDKENKLILASGNSLFEVDKDDLAQKTKIGEFALPLWKKLAIKSKLLQRLIRGFFYNVLPLSNGDILVTFDKSVGIIKKNKKFLLLKGLKRPARVLRNSIAQDLDGSLYFGEYFANKRRDLVRVYRYIPGNDSVDAIFTFKKGSIRHVHGIYYDEFSESLWCVTGDVGGECQIIQTYDGFKTFNVIGAGDETWRASSLQFTKDFIYYGTDAEFQQNKIFQISRDGYKRQELGSVDGPIYYSIKRHDVCFFQVTAELCRQTDKHVSMACR